MEIQRALRLANRNLKATREELLATILFGNQFDISSGNINEIRVRLEDLPNIANKFETYQAEVEELDDTGDEEQCISERVGFRNQLYSAKATLMHLLDAHRNSTSSSPSFSELTKHRNENPMRLPPVEIPKFNGDWQCWTSFIDSFNAMFHNNEGLAPVQKFHYLKSCLQGQPSDIIRSIPTTGENYLQAYNTLTNRYENKGVIIQSHIKSFLETPKVHIASAANLQKLHHHIMSNVNALKALAQPIDSWDAWLVTLICSRLDCATVGEWQLQYNKKDLPSFRAVEEFLFNRIAAYEAGEINVSSMAEKKSLVKIPSHKLPEKKVFHVRSERTNNTMKCVVCNENHKLYQCKRFNELSVPERRELVSKKRLCFKCMSINHQARMCTFSTCPQCGQHHNSKLHLDESEGTTNADGTSITVEHSLCVTQELKQSMHVSGDSVLLAIAIIFINDSSGKPQPCRALLDSGSQVNFITDTCAQYLKLSRTKCYLPIAGVNSMRSNAQKLYPVSMSSRFHNFKTLIDLHVLPSISTQLPVQPLMSTLNVPEIVTNQLADPGYGVPGEIHVLLGAEIFYTLFTGEKLDITNSLTFHKTLLGWVLTGKVLGSQVGHIEAPEHSYFNQGRFSSALSLFVVNKNIGAKDKIDVEEHFLNTVSRNTYGQFVVRLPLCESPDKLSDSRYMAVQRLLNLERRLVKNSYLSREYEKFMSEYLALGHMEVVPPEEMDRKSYYLPHHAVIKFNSLTTKVRVVFDGSTPSKSGVSLNDILACGPTVQPDLFSILLRFRLHKYVMAADVEKMYRQVYVAREDCDLQRIVYRRSPEEPIVDYRLLTVTYGTRSASYLATKCLSSLSNEANAPACVRAIREDFYVDDLLTGAQSEENCYDLHLELCKTLSSAGMNLRKWCSNSKFLMNKLACSNDDPSYLLPLNEVDTISTLGLTWQPSSDSFLFTVKEWSPPSQMSKRSLLSDMNKIFDPLGLLTPVLIKGKIFLQQLWSMKIDWDTPLSPDLQSRWQGFYYKFKHLQSLFIPRTVISNVSSSVTLHGFSDASQQAYGACVYIRSEMPNGCIAVSLFTSRSRVAPLHATSIPRLELSGAQLFAELIDHVVSEMSKVNVVLNNNNIIYWTDSTIVLSWLNTCKPLKVFVSNRVAQILDLSSPSQWRHVPTESNPADLISRGMSANSICDCEFWWRGPHWLSEPEDCWPKHSEII